MLCPYVLETFAVQLNELKVGDGGINSVYKFAGTTPDITLTWVCTIYVLDARLKVNIPEVPKWDLTHVKGYISVTKNSCSISKSSSKPSNWSCLALRSCGV